MAHAYNILPMLFPILFWGTVIGYIIYRKKHPVKRSKAEKIVLRCILGAFLCFVVFAGGTMLVSMYRSIARSKVYAANSNAKFVCKAFYAAVEDMDEEGQLEEHSKEIYNGRFDDTAEEGSLEYNMHMYFSEECYYTIVTDGNWHVLYTLWSRQPITPDEIRVYEFDAQLRFMRSLFTDHSELVGYYENKDEQKEMSTTW